MLQTLTITRHVMLHLINPLNATGANMHQVLMFIENYGIERVNYGNLNGGSLAGTLILIMLTNTLILNVKIFKTDLGKVNFSIGVEG